MREARAAAVVSFLLALLQHQAHAWTAPPPLSSIGQQGSRFVSQVSTPAARTPASAAASQAGSRRMREVPTCKLQRLPARTLKRVVPLRPTPEKYLAFFGQTPFDRRRKMINFLGGLFAFYWAAFFATRNVYVLGPGGINAIAWRGSCLALFLQTFLRPVMGSYNRALGLWGDGTKEARRKTKGALFTGRVIKTGFALSPQASRHRTHFQMLVEDESGRELLFDVPQVPEYRRVRKGMLCAVVVLSRSTGFHELTGVTEAYLPELDLFVGRFPLLDKRVFWDLLQDTNERNRRKREESGGGGGGALTASRKQARLGSAKEETLGKNGSSGRGSGGAAFSREGSFERGNHSQRVGQQQQRQRGPAARDMATNTGSSMARASRSGGQGPATIDGF